jgi:predicted nucleic acid-binding protein
MIAYLRGEVGADAVEDLLDNRAEPCMAHAVNLCEVYHKFMKWGSKREAKTAIQDLLTKGLTTREDLDVSLWLAAGDLKATMRDLPLADCFLVALAKRTDSETVTADHLDFDEVSARGFCRVRFIR